MGRSAKIELLRRILPLLLAVLGVVGSVTFLSILTSLMCLASAFAIYAALPQVQKPADAVWPKPSPSIWMSDLIGFTVGVPLFSCALIGAFYGTHSSAPLLLLLLLPASLSVVIFVQTVRQETSWIRFFGNGFEIAHMGMRAKLKYSDLSKAEIRQIKLSGATGWFNGFSAGSTFQKVNLLNPKEATLALVFTARNGAVFSVSSEIVPDLRRILIGMDRCGVDLPQGVSDWQRKTIRKIRERMYGTGEEASVKVSAAVSDADKARIAATIRKYRQQTA